MKRKKNLVSLSKELNEKMLISNAALQIVKGGFIIEIEEIDGA